MEEVVMQQEERKITLREIDQVYRRKAPVGVIRGLALIFGLIVLVQAVSLKSLYSRQLSKALPIIQNLWMSSTVMDSLISTVDESMSVKEFKSIVYETISQDAISEAFADFNAVDRELWEHIEKIYPLYCAAFLICFILQAVLRIGNCIIQKKRLRWRGQ